MATDFRLRQQAIRLRWAGKSIIHICRQLGCSREWFYKWWHRYQQQGADGLRERARAPHTSPHQLPDEVRQVIVAIRDRLARRRGAHARYRLAGTPPIQHELAVLGYTPLPSLCPIERGLHQSGRTSPPLRWAPRALSPAYPGPRARRSGHITVLGVRVLVGQRWKGRYVGATLYTRTARLKIYQARRLVKEVAYPLRGSG